MACLFKKQQTKTHPPHKNKSHPTEKKPKTPPTEQQKKCMQSLSRSKDVD